MKTVFLVMEESAADVDEGEPPAIIGIFETRAEAEEAAKYNDRTIIEVPLGVVGFYQ